jgi:hypothetical protein
MEEILEQPAKKSSKSVVKETIFAAFHIGRTLGREFAASLIVDTLKNMVMPSSVTDLQRFYTFGWFIFRLHP